MNTHSPRDTRIRCFTGTGQTRAEGHPIALQFEAYQLADGSIRADCRTSDGSADAIARAVHSEEGMARLEGTTGQGLRLCLSDLRWWNAEQIGQTVQWTAAYGVLRAESDKPDDPRIVKLHLTNLPLQGDEPYEERTELGAIFTTQLRLALGASEVILRPIPHSSDLLMAAHYERGLSATAVATVALATAADISRARDVVDDLCLLLSLLHGQCIIAVNCDAVNDVGATVQFVSRSAPAKRIGWGHLPRHMIPNHPQSAKRFVQSAYQALANAKTAWSIDKAIDYYLDARRDGDEFEFWGLKMAVCMEFLCSQYARTKDRRFTIPNERFRRAMHAVREQVERALREHGTATSDEAETMVRRLCELNRPSLRDTLTAMNTEVGARISGTAVRQFIRIRNKLVHTGAYDEALGPPAEQYDFLERYVWQFMLGVLGQPVDSIWDGYRWESDGVPVVDTLRQNVL